LMHSPHKLTSSAQTKTLRLPFSSIISWLSWSYVSTSFWTKTKHVSRRYTLFSKQQNQFNSKTVFALQICQKCVFSTT
jgi:hypothetical protein